MKDTLLVAAERLARQLYWSSPWLRQWRHKKQALLKPAPQECELERLLEGLRKIGVKERALVMVHTGISGLNLASKNAAEIPNAVGQAQMLLDGLLELVGPTGTLVMPTHARYQNEEGDKEKLITYDPRRTPCGVGLVNELFWRKSGVKRSAFPFNMLAASGPLADTLLKDNLNEKCPSPHGPDSGYARFCELNGLVVSIGVRLGECLTLAHVVEEVRKDWPIKDFFEEHRYRVVQDGVAKEWTVRQRRGDLAMYSYCRKKMCRDLTAEGVIHEGSIGTVLVDYARAQDVFNFFMRKTERRPYPYYALWLMPKAKR